MNWFAMRYPEAHIIAIEPAPDNCELLRQNTSSFALEVWQAGIVAGDVHAYLFNSHGNAEMAWQVTSELTDRPVKLVTVQTLLAKDTSGHYLPFLLRY